MARPNPYESLNTTQAERALLVRDLQKFDTNGDRQLSKLELQAMIADGINAGQETTGGCGIFFSYAFKDPMHAKDLTPKAFPPHVIKRAQQVAAREAAETMNDLLQSSIGKQAFPEGVKGFAVPADYEALIPLVKHKLLACAEEEQKRGDAEKLQKTQKSQRSAHR